MRCTQPTLAWFTLAYEDALAVPASLPAEEASTCRPNSPAPLPAQPILRPGIASLERWLDLCA
jgi:hypothetical protein